MAHSDLQGFFTQLFLRRAASSVNAAADSGSLTDEVASGSTVVRSHSPAHLDLDPAGVPPTGTPCPLANVTLTGLSSWEQKLLLEHMRNTGDPNEQLYAEYELQTLRHIERFSSLMGRVCRAQRQREAQVDEECRNTQTAFENVRALRTKEVLDLREALVRTEVRERELLRDRVLQQCDRHDQQAQVGLQACMRFAEIVLSGEVEIGRNVLARVRSQIDVFEHRDGLVDSEVSGSAHTRLSRRVQEALSRDDTSPPLLTWTREPRIVDDTTHQYAEHRLECVPIPSPRLPNGSPPDREFPEPSPAPSIQPSDSGLLEGFDKHFADVERDRKQQWRSLQDQHDADLGIWRERFQALLVSLASRFYAERAPGSSENAFEAGDKLDYTTARETFSFAEGRRALDLGRLWQQVRVSFTLHHDAFVERLRAAESEQESIDYVPQALVPIPPRAAAVWPLMGPMGRSGPISQCDDSPQFLPPFSLTSLLTVPRISRALPTAPPRVQIRTAFRDAQALRDRQFEATLAAFEEELQAAERKHEVALETELRSWRNQADTAERERAALFSRRVEAARGEWDLYRVRRDKDNDHLVREFEERFSHAQAAREADFMADVRKLHEQFTGVVQELLET